MKSQASEKSSVKTPKPEVTTGHFLIWCIVAVATIGFLVTISISFGRPNGPTSYRKMIRAEAGNVTVRVGDHRIRQQGKEKKLVLTTEELAEELDVNADTVRRRASKGDLRKYDGEKLVRFQKIDRNAWLRIVDDSFPTRARIVPGDSHTDI